MAKKRHKKIIDTRWIDTDKNDGKGNPNIRSRLVAKDFKGNSGIRFDLFASTPPLEALKILLAKTASRQKRQDDDADPKCLAYFHGLCAGHTSTPP